MGAARHISVCARGNARRCIDRDLCRAQIKGPSRNEGANPRLREEDLCELAKGAELVAFMQIRNGVQQGQIPFSRPHITNAYEKEIDAKKAHFRVDSNVRAACKKFHRGAKEKLERAKQNAQSELKKPVLVLRRLFGGIR